jgi:hypothetical protein
MTSISTRNKGDEAGQKNFEKIISECYLGVKNGKKNEHGDLASLALVA